MTVASTVSGPITSSTAVFTLQGPKDSAQVFIPEKATKATRPEGTPDGESLAAIGFANAIACQK